MRRYVSILWIILNIEVKIISGRKKEIETLVKDFLIEEHKG